MTTFTLENERVQLLPLTAAHYDILLPLSQEVDLYRYGGSDVSTPEKLRAYIDIALQAEAHKTAIPFLIYDKHLEAYAGSTRFGNIDHTNKVLHIGWTWLGTRFRGSGLNSNIKYVMLQHAFETMPFEKVAFRIDERNIISRKAVEKLGATQEGILRSHVITKSGIRRNTVCYGIVKNEWKSTKAILRSSANIIK